MRESDALTRADLADWLDRNRVEGGRSLPADIAASHALLMQLAIEGLAIRAIREPDLDPALLGLALQQFVACLMPAAVTRGNSRKRNA